MKRYIIHDDAGNILKQGTSSSNDLSAQMLNAGEHIREVAGDVLVSDTTHKVDITRDLRGSKLIKEDMLDKTPEEIEAASPTRERPVRVPMARITQAELDSILARLDVLESR